MVVITCDRCGKNMEMDFMGYLFSDHKENAYIPSMFINGKDPNTGKTRKFDLCEDCEKKVYHFIFDDAFYI